MDNLYKEMEKLESDMINLSDEFYTYITIRDILFSQHINGMLIINIILMSLIIILTVSSVIISILYDGTLIPECVFIINMCLLVSIVVINCLQNKLYKMSKLKLDKLFNLYSKECDTDDR